MGWLRDGEIGVKKLVRVGCIGMLFCGVGGLNCVLSCDGR